MSNRGSGLITLMAKVDSENSVYMPLQRIAWRSSLVMMLGAMILVSGCAPVAAVKTDAQEVNPNTAVVAFSVRTSALTQFDEMLTPSRVLFSGTDSRVMVGSRLETDESGVAYVLYEIPESGVVFNELIFGIRPGFKTTMPGPEIPLTRGEITYLGRLEVQDFKFELSEDSTTYTPTHVKLAFTDKSADDMAAFTSRYAMFSAQNTRQDILKSWSNFEFVPLAPQVRGTNRVQDATRSPNSIDYGPLPQRPAPSPPPGRQ